MLVNYTLFYKNIVFMGEAEYSYFAADFKPQYFRGHSQIRAYGISVLECIWCMEGVKVILEPACR